MREVSTITTLWTIFRDFFESAGMRFDDVPSDSLVDTIGLSRSSQMKDVEFLFGELTQDIVKQFQDNLTEHTDQSDYSFSRNLFKEATHMSTRLVLHSTVNAGVVKRIPLITLYRYSLLSNASICELLFGRNPDIVCTLNEQAFLRVLSAVTCSRHTAQDVLNVFSSFRTLRNEYLNTMPYQADNDNANYLYNIHSFREFLVKKNGTENSSKLRFLFPSDFEDRYFQYLLSNGYARHQEICQQATMTNRSLDALLRTGLSRHEYLYQVFRRLTAVDVVGALIAGYFSPDMLLIGETLSSVPRYCICDFFNNKYYELSHNEAKWIQLFNCYHPEDQSRIIATLIHKLQIRSLPTGYHELSYYEPFL